MKIQTRLRKELLKIADPKKAPQMQAYMKSAMPYYGVQSPLLKKVCKDLFKDIVFADYEDWENTVQDLWREAKFREERYAALQLCGHRSSREFQVVRAMDLYEELIVTGAWWDYVDDIASHRVGSILRNFPKPMKSMMRKWSVSSNIWKCRTSIISQLGFGKDTDLKHLYSCIEPSMSSKEFFLQKAIGWALRQYAWTNPREIQRYVKENSNRLAPLSIREALKNLNKLKGN